MPSTVPVPVTIEILAQGANTPYRVRLDMPDGSSYESVLDYAALTTRLGALDDVWLSGQPVEYGQALFQALFSGELALHYGEALGAAGDLGLRLRLRPDDTAPALHVIPWERMYQPLGNAWVPLAAAPDVLLSRLLSKGTKWALPVAGGPLRMLVVVSSPYPQGHPMYVDVAREQKAISDVIRQFKGQIQLDFLDGPVTLQAIANKLDEGDGFDILHYTGHGEWDDEQQTAHLILEQRDDSGQVSPDGVSADDLAERLRTGRHLPHLIMLAACQTAQLSTASALRGAGPRLVQAGCPAVICMQDLIEADVARVFSARFYSSLLTYGIVDLAANEARRALLEQWSWQWAVPVLFMRLPDGMLFSPQQRLRPAEREPYKGLVPYSLADHDLFRGRDSDATLVGDHIRTNRAVVVSGDAGAGLTSLLEAGVRPGLEGDAQTLVVTVAEYAGLAREFRRQLHIDGLPAALPLPGDAALPDVLAAALGARFAHLILVLDQFERAFELPARDREALIGTTIPF